MEPDGGDRVKSEFRLMSTKFGGSKKKKSVAMQRNR